jgi:hypothetical protein
MNELAPHERTRVARTLARAVYALETSPIAALDPAVRRLVGHPAPREERRLASALACLVEKELASRVR